MDELIIPLSVKTISNTKQAQSANYSPVDEELAGDKLCLVKDQNKAPFQRH